MQSKQKPKSKQLPSIIKKSKRYLVFDQLLKTQKDYYNDLTIILDDIRGALLQKNIITQQENTMLFLYVEQMKQLSLQFSKCLQQIQDTWDEQMTMVGQRISYFNQYFKIYRDYCSQYENKLKIIQTIRKHPQSSLIQKSLKLQQYESYMIKPIQRPVKYHLLLKQYLKGTPQNHLDISHIKQAISKYQEVNNQNNQFLSKLDSRMKVLQLQKKYSIFNNRRIPELIAEFKCTMYPSTQCIAYILQDQVIIVKAKVNECMKFQLATDSFVESQIDGKYYQNRCYLGGKKQSIHLDFQTQEQVKIFCKTIKGIIFKIFNREWDKKQRQTKLIDPLQKDLTNVFYPPKARITIYSVDSSFQTLTLKISVPYPNKMFQFITLPFQKIYKVYFLLLANHSYISAHFSNFDTSNKFTNTVMEVKLPIIQRFLHFIFRDEEILLRERDKLREKIAIQPQLWNFLTSQIYECYCQKCLNFNESQSFIEFKKILKQSQKSNQKLLKYLQQTQDFEASQNYRKINEKKCVFYSFNLQKCISLLPAQQFKTMADKLTLLECYLGRIDYGLIPRELRPFKIEVVIYLPKANQETLKIYINEYTTASQVKQMVRIKLNIASLKDYAFVLVNQKRRMILHGDEKILQFRQILEYNKKEGKQQQTNGTQSVFVKKFSELKSTVQSSVKQLISGKKYKLCLHKLIYFDQGVQNKQIQNDKNRMQLISDEIIYLLKAQPSQTSISDTANIIALDYCLQKKRKSQKTQQNACSISMSEILNVISKPYLNAYTEGYSSDLEFGTKILQNIKVFSQFSIEKLQTQLIRLSYASQIWGKYYFQVNKYQKQLNQQFFNQEVMIGINCKCLQIVNKKCLKKMWLNIDMKTLKYRIGINSIFIQIMDEYQEFHVQMIGILRYTLQIYKGLNKKF